MATKTLKFGIIMSHVDEFGNTVHSGDTLMYGNYVKNPNDGIRYTYVKTPEGPKLIVSTENSEDAKKVIENFIEVNTKDSTGLQPKLTFRIIIDSENNASTWNENIEKLFLEDTKKNWEKLTPYIHYIKDDDIGNLMVVPFYNERSIITDLSFTPGRSFRNTGDLIVELFRRFMDENVKFLDEFLEIFNEGFNALDYLKLDDMKQDEKIGNFFSRCNYWEIMVGILKDYLNKNQNLFQSRRKKYIIDLKNYRNNLLCWIKLKNNTSEPYPFYNGGLFATNKKKTMAGLKFTSDGYLIDGKINIQEDNILKMPTKPEYTIRLRGGDTYDFFTNADNLEYEILGSEPIPGYLTPYLNTHFYNGDLNVTDLYFYKDEDMRNKNPFRLRIDGIEGAQEILTSFHDAYWRSNSKEPWGVTAYFQYYREHNNSGGNGNFSGWRDEVPDKPFILGDNCKLDFKSVVDRGNFDKIISYCKLININTNKSVQIMASWGNGDNWSGTFTDTIVLTDDQIKELGGKGAQIKFQSGLDNNHGSAGCNQKATVTISSSKTTGDNTLALQNNRDTDDMANIRINVPLKMSIDDIKRKFSMINIYLDTYYGVSAYGANGGITGFLDKTNRCSYQGKGILNDPENSVPKSKIKEPKEMIDLNSVIGSEISFQLDTSFIPTDGTWMEMYKTPVSENEVYSIMQKRGANVDYSGVYFKYFLRVKDQNNLEILINYFQYINGGDSESQFQCAGRTSGFIYGFKNNNSSLIIDEVYLPTENNQESDVDSDFSTRNNWLYDGGIFEVWKKDITFDHVKVNDAILSVGINCNFHFQISFDHSGTCYASSTRASGSLIKWNTQSWGDTSGGGGIVPNITPTSKVDTSTNVALKDSQLFIQYAPDENISNRVLYDVLILTHNGAEGRFKLYASSSTSGNNRTVTLMARFESSGQWGRWRPKLSYSISPGYRLAPGSKGVQCPLTSTRPEGKVLQLEDTITNTYLYAQLIKDIQNAYNTKNNKIDNTGITSVIGYEQVLPLSNAGNVEIGVNGNFYMLREYDHKNSSYFEQWHTYGNLKEWTHNHSGGNHYHPRPTPQSDPPDLIYGENSDISQNQFYTKFTTKNLTDAWSKRAEQVFRTDLGTWCFRVYAKIVSGQIYIKYQYEMLDIIGHRSTGFVSYSNKAVVKLFRGEKTTLYVEDFISSEEKYILPDSNVIITSKSLNDILDSVNKLSMLKSVVNKPSINIQKIGKLNNVVNRSILLGINLTSSLTISRQVIISKKEVKYIDIFSNGSLQSDVYNLNEYISLIQNSIHPEKVKIKTIKNNTVKNNNILDLPDGVVLIHDNYLPNQNLTILDNHGSINYNYNYPELVNDVYKADILFRIELSKINKLFTYLGSIPLYHYDNITKSLNCIDIKLNLFLRNNDGLEIGYNLNTQVNGLDANGYDDILSTRVNINIDCISGG